MIHYNKQIKYQNLYRHLKELMYCPSIEMLYFRRGIIIGWTNALLLTHWTSDELLRFERVVDEIVKVKEKELVLFHKTA